MAEKKFLLLSILILTFFLTGCSDNNAETKKIVAGEKNETATTTLNKYYSEIDYSCQTDSDCIIKDIRNCCGYYPQCVNSNARTDPNLVSDLCKKEGAASICGFEEIQSCKCSGKRCESQ